tara:strand:+ start:71 stop:469 length:399 start_codon:yes stop_codon:yes gene_type:complete
MNNWIVYYESDGRIAFHNYIGNEAKVQKLCSVNPGTTYMAGKCHERHCKVDVSQDPPVVLHNQNLIPVTAWMRERRDIMLTASDWTQAVDSPLSDSKKAEWQTYRQALRDITNTYPNPSNKEDVTWPTPPGS